MARFDIIAFDGDDTLWHNERLFGEAQERFRQLLAGYHSPSWIDERLEATEKRNIPHFGYGIKGFALSMIETAIELTEGRVAGRDIQVIVDVAKRMLSADVELLDQAASVVAELSESYELMLITKGDLHDQEKKVARSGIGPRFRDIEIVSEKNSETYAEILRKHAVPAGRFLMVGNSLRSDILPVLALGASAVHIPYELTWTHELADPPPLGHPSFHSLLHIGLLPQLLRELG